MLTQNPSNSFVKINNDSFDFSGYFINSIAVGKTLYSFKRTELFTVYKYELEAEGPQVKKQQVYSEHRMPHTVSSYAITLLQNRFILLTGGYDAVQSSDRFRQTLLFDTKTDRIVAKPDHPSL